MSHAQCPPSRRGHSWRKLILAELPPGSSFATLKLVSEQRICERCGTRGRVDKQGITRVEGST